MLSEKYNDDKVKRAAKRKSQELAQSLSPVKTRAVRGGVCKDADKEDEEICFFCDKAGSVMHQALTDSKGIDRTVEDYAKAVNDAKILAKLAKGDMHSQSAVYHKDCLSALHNKARSHKTEHSKTEKHTYSESIALSELVTFIEETRLDEGVHLYFNLADLAKLYHKRLEQLGVSIPKRINTTRLKERLLDRMPNLKVHTKGRDVVLAFDDDIANALIIASQFKKDSNIMHLAKTALIVRKEMLEKKQAFDGSFPPEALTESVPDSLLSLMNMIVEGPTSNIKLVRKDEAIVQRL